jgi:hypothetical protein
MLDTLAYAEALIAAGVAESHAKAHAKAMRNHVIPDLATKQDVTDVRSEMQNLRALIEQSFAETHQRIWQAALAVVLGTAALVGLALRFLQ